MAKSKSDDRAHDDYIYGQLTRLKHKDLQLECVVRGMEPLNVVSASHHELASFFYANFNNSKDLTLIEVFNDYVDGILEERGHQKDSPLRHPILRLGYIKPLESDDESSPKPKKPESKKESTASTAVTAQVKREKSEWGITTGTKKYLTYQLTIEENMTVDKVIEAVMKSYEDAEPKSIKIWYGRAKKLIPTKA